MTTQIIDGKHACGFCSTNNHGHCPGAVRNGNGNLIRCPCREQLQCGLLRCLDCGWRRPEDVNADTWTCWEHDECETRRRIRMESNPAVIQIRQIRAELAASKTTDEETDGEPTRRRSVTPGASRPTTGACLCCGETTRGGNFLPGHDSRYLTRLVEQFKDPVLRAAGEEQEDVRRRAAAISPAFLAKFDKRAGVLS